LNDDLPVSATGPLGTIGFDPIRSQFGLSAIQRKSIFALTPLVAIMGFWTPERAAWAAFVRKCFGFSLTECGDTAAGFLMVVVFDWLSHGQARRFGRLAGSGPGYA
jgi:hypothetical protein